MGKGQSFQKMVLGKLDIHIKKNEIGSLSYTTQKTPQNNLKWVKDVNVGPEAVKFLEEKYSKPTTYEHSSCELSKMRTRVHVSNHVSWFTCLAYIVTCVHPLQVVVILCTLLYSAV